MNSEIAENVIDKDRKASTRQEEQKFRRLLNALGEFVSSVSCVKFEGCSLARMRSINFSNFPFACL